MTKKLSIYEQRESFVIGCKLIEQVRKTYCQEFLTMGVDPSINSTGWAIRNSDISVKVGTITAKSSGFSRLIRIERRLRKILDGISPFIGIEGYAYNKKYGREQAGELGGVIRRLFFFKKRPLLVISPLTVKAWVKAAKKNQILLEIYDQFKIKITNDDAADAFLLSEITRNALLLAHHVVTLKLDSDNIKDYFGDCEYIEQKGLKKLLKYQASSLFRLILSHGKQVAFFLKSPTLLKK